MTHPLVGLLGVALPLIVGSASAEASGNFLGFDRHSDNAGSPVEMSAGDQESAPAEVVAGICQANSSRNGSEVHAASVGARFRVARGNWEHSRCDHSR